MSGSLIDLFVVLEVPEDLDLELKERLDTGCGSGISLSPLWSSKGPFSFFSKSLLWEGMMLA